MNLPVSSFAPLKLTLPLEQLDTGAVAASIEIPPASPAISPWIKYAGIFENDPDFAVTIAAAIRADRHREDDTEVDPSVYAIKDQNRCNQIALTIAALTTQIADRPRINRTQQKIPQLIRNIRWWIPR
jgi:hypothetical protein